MYHMHYSTKAKSSYRSVFHLTHSLGVLCEKNEKHNGTNNIKGGVESLFGIRKAHIKNVFSVSSPAVRSAPFPSDRQLSAKSLPGPHHSTRGGERMQWSSVIDPDSSGAFPNQYPPHACLPAQINENTSCVNR